MNLQRFNDLHWASFDDLGPPTAPRSLHAVIRLRRHLVDRLCGVG